MAAAVDPMPSHGQKSNGARKVGAKHAFTRFVRRWDKNSHFIVMVAPRRAIARACVRGAEKGSRDAAARATIHVFFGGGETESGRKRRGWPAFADHDDRVWRERRCEAVGAASGAIAIVRQRKVRA